MLIRKIRCGRYDLTLEQRTDLEVVQAEMWRRDICELGIKKPWKIRLR